MSATIVLMDNNREEDYDDIISARQSLVRHAEHGVRCYIIIHHDSYASSSNEELE